MEPSYRSMWCTSPSTCMTPGLRVGHRGLSTAVSATAKETGSTTLALKTGLLKLLYLTQDALKVTRSSLVTIWVAMSAFMSYKNTRKKISPSYFSLKIQNIWHNLKSLDVACFRPMKTHWRLVLHSWKTTASGRKAASVPKNIFTRLLRQLSENMSPANGSTSNVRAGFRKCEVVPFNQQTALAKLPLSHEAKDFEDITLVAPIFKILWSTCIKYFMEEYITVTNIVHCTVVFSVFINAKIHILSYYDYSI